MTMEYVIHIVFIEKQEDYYVNSGWIKYGLPPAPRLPSPSKSSRN